MALCTSKHGYLDDFDEVIKDLRSHFGDPDLAATALRRIESLRQTNSCASYASRFRELLIHVDFSEATKIQKFYNGLKEEVKDLLVAIPTSSRPKRFDAYIAAAIDADNRVHQQHIECQSHAC